MTVIIMHDRASAAFGGRLRLVLSATIAGRHYPPLPSR